MGLLKKVERELLFRKNLKLFEEKLPPVAEVIKKVKIPMKILEKEQKIDVLIKDISVYGGDAFALIEKQIEIFEMQEPRIFTSVSFENPPEREDVIAYNYTHRLTKITGTIFSTPSLSKDIPVVLLIVIGVGIGKHIEVLLSKYNIQNLILVDIPLYFKSSLYYLDWEKVFDYFSKDKRQLHIVILDNKYAEEHPDKAYEPILKAIQGMNPATAYLGYYFQHLAYNPPLDPISWLRKHPVFKQLFYGYFDDELWSLDWTIEKVLRGIPLYYGDVKVPRGIPAFVLGAGPSLDKSLDTIEKNKDKAILISCGSTITSLQRAGIKPDIHVELERTKYTYDVLSEVDREFLRGIFLVTTNAVWTDCFELFDEGGFFLKMNDAGSSMFQESGAPYLMNLGPTVTATGVSLAANLGFKEVYLFGVDLGVKDIERHHSSLSNYFNKKSMLYGFKPMFNRKLPGNFGGEVLTNDLFEETAYAIHKTIYRYGIKVYNLSDGIRIKDTIPLEFNELLLKSSIKKQEVLRLIKENFRRDYRDKVKPQEILINLLTSLQTWIEILQSINFRKIEDCIHLFTTLERFLESLGETGFILLFHNTYQWSLYGLGHMLKLKDKDMIDFAKFFLSLYLDFLKSAEGKLKALLRKHYSI